MTTIQSTVVGTYVILGSTGPDGEPTRDTVTQTARHLADEQWVLMEEDDHYNQEEQIGKPYKSLTRLQFAAGRRREKLSMKEGEYEAALAEYEARIAEEHHRTQAGVDEIAAQGLEALWAEITQCGWNRDHSKKLGLAILEKLGVTADPEKVSVSCGSGELQEAPQGLKEVAAPGPVRESIGAYRYCGRFMSRQVVRWHAQRGPFVIVYGKECRDPGLTTGEGMTPQEIYAPPGSWIQFRDSGTGRVWGYRFV